MLRIGILALVFGSAVVSAQPYIREVSGASNFARTPLATVYGGLAGPSCTAPADAGTCDSCAAGQVCTTAPLCACNTKKIKDGGIVTLLLNPKTRVGEARLVRGASTFDLIPTVKSNDGHQIDFNWSVICQNSTLSSCLSAQGPTAYLLGSIFIDRNDNGVADDTQRMTPVRFQLFRPSEDYAVEGLVYSEGISGFTPYPGDRSVYLEDLVVASSFPTLSYGSKAKKVRVFLSPKNMTEATPQGAEKTVDLDLADDGSLLSSKIANLVNGQAYFIRIAIVDEAENVVLFFPNMGADAACDSGDAVHCPWAATPN